MKFFPSVFCAVGVILLTACSESPAPVEKKAPAPPPSPISGRQAIQSVYGPARIWASDAQPISVQSANLAEMKLDASEANKGKAGAWEIVFASPSMGQQRSYTWSAVETEGWHKGVFGGQKAAWSPGGAQRLFSIAQVMTDTPEAFDTAAKASAEYLEKPGKRPRVSYELESSGRFTGPVWRVLWGGTVSSAEYFVVVDAMTGKLLGKN